MVARPQGIVGCGGVKASAPNGHPAAGALSATGATQWTAVLPGDMGAFDLAHVGLGETIVAGRKKYGGVVATRLSSSGKALWTVTHLAKNNITARQVVVLPGGDLLFVGHGYAEATELLRMTPGGTASWDATLPGAVGHAGAMTGAATILVGGRTNKGDKLHLSAVTPDGALVWSRDYADATKNDVRMVGATGGGVFVLSTGDAGGTAGLQAWVMRVGPWGHESCAAAAQCQSMGPLQCDDGDACTLDWCKVTQGCVHTKVVGCADGA